MNKQPTTIGMYLLQRAFLFSLLFVIVVPLALGQTSITLSATGYKLHGVNTVDLFWTGATSANVDIYRNGILVATPPDNGGFYTYTDSTGDKGGKVVYTYRVCEAGTGNCSNQVSVRFGGGRP